MEIVSGIHRIPSVYNGRWLYQHVIVHQDRIALIDTGIAETPEKVVFPYLKKNGLDPANIDVVITTHCDADHCGGNETVRRVSPHALFFSQSTEAPLLASTEKIIAERYGEFQKHGFEQTEQKRDALRTKLGRGIPIDISYDSVMDVRFPLRSEEPGLTLRLIHSPGHTAGHSVVEVPELSVLIIADALLSGGVPDTEGNLVLPPTNRFIDDYVQTIEKLKKKDAEWILPTHFHAIRGGEAWQTFCKESLAFVEKVDEFILNVLSDIPSAGLLDFVEAAAKRPLGGWPETMNQELTYCLLGGLERLERKKRVEQHRLMWKLA